MKPNFLIIGAPKCGTTSLYALFRQHPEIGMPEVKELRFFSDDSNYSRGWSWYESFFQGLEEKKAVGEATPRYTVRCAYPQAAKRINRELPDARLIYIVRHPIRRMISHWMAAQRSGNCNMPLDRAIREFPILVDGSRYLNQIHHYKEHRPAEHILVLFFEDFVSDAPAMLRRCFEFLGVDSTVSIAEADRPRNAKVDTSLMSWARRRLPGLVRTGPDLPKPIRRIVGPLFRRPITKRPDLDEKTLAWAVDQIADETTEFLKHHGKSPNYWDLFATKRS